MPLLINNLEWMTWNIVLALIPLVFAYLVITYSKNFLTPIFFIFWFLFLPNTIYLVTDIEYLPGQISKTAGVYDVLLICEYLIVFILGIVTYLWVLKAVTDKFKIPEKFIYVFNFFVAFACAIGKIQRTESWDVIVNPVRVINDTQRSLMSPSIILFVILFGILINIIWISGTLQFKNGRVRN